jgi:hypothetical protein
MPFNLRVPLFLDCMRACNPAVGETGVCKRQAPSQGPEKQRGLRAFPRETASVFLGGRCLTRAEGQRP